MGRITVGSACTEALRPLWRSKQVHFGLLSPAEVVQNAELCIFSPRLYEVRLRLAAGACTGRRLCAQLERMQLLAPRCSVPQSRGYVRSGPSASPRRTESWTDAWHARTHMCCMQLWKAGFLRRRLLPGMPACKHTGWRQS